MVGADRAVLAAAMFLAVTVIVAATTLRGGSPRRPAEAEVDEAIETGSLAEAMA